jgi:hypothetical protein
MYPRRRDEVEIVDLPSPDIPEKLDKDDTVEKERTGDGHEDMAGVGEIDGDGDEERRR